MFVFVIVFVILPPGTAPVLARLTRRVSQMAKKAPISPQKASAPVAPPPARPASPLRIGGLFPRRAAMSGLIFALAAGLYLNTLPLRFALDDDMLLSMNIFTRRGFAGIPDILSHDTFYGFFRNETNFVAGGRYRPLTAVMFAAEGQLFGKQMRAPDGSPLKDDQGYVLYEYPPFVGHLGNVLLYGLLCLLLYRLLLLLFCPDTKENNATGHAIAAFGAMLFAVHPLHTEVVANIKGRDEILCLLFALLTCYWTLQAYYSPNKKTLYMAGAVVSYFLALFSKENPMTFLAVIPMMLFFFAKTDKPIAAFVPTVVRYTAPFVVVAAVFWVGIRGQIVGTAISGNVTELMNNPFLRYTGEGYVPIATGERIATILHTWLKYLQLLVVPHPLTNDYYPRQIALMKMGSPTVILSVLVHLGALAYALVRLPKKDPVAFGILFYLVTFSVVSNLVFPIGTNMGERFMFIPSVGIVLGAGVLLARAYARRPAIVLGAVALIGVLYGAKTISRNPDWHDNYTLFLADAKTSSNSAKAQCALAGQMLDKAEKLANTQPIDWNSLTTISQEAQVLLDKSLSIHPTYYIAWLLKGDSHYYRRGFSEAIRCYDQVEKYKSDETTLDKRRAMTYREYGKYLGSEKRDVPAAIAALEKSYAIAPKDRETLRLLGVAYGYAGQHDKSLAIFGKFAAGDPGDPQGPLFIGQAYFFQGKPAVALPYIRKGIAQDPSLEKTLSPAILQALQQ